MLATQPSEVFYRALVPSCPLVISSRPVDYPSIYPAQRFHFVRVKDEEHSKNLTSLYIIILKQWIVFFARSDWLLMIKLRISNASHLHFGE